MTPPQVEAWQAALQRSRQAPAQPPPVDADTDDVDTDAAEPIDHVLSEHADAEVRWLAEELGRRGLSGFYRRGDLAVSCSRIGSTGYIDPPPPAHPEYVDPLTGELRRRRPNDNGPATVKTATADRVLYTLAQAYRVKRMKGRGSNRRAYGCLFPAAAAKLVLSELDHAPNLRPLRGVTHTPLVREDGSILRRPGYDDASGFLLLPTVTVRPVPVHPTSAQLAEAVGLLQTMLADFTWSGGDDFANYLGLLLTPLVRQLAPVAPKLGAVMAHQPGSGKTLLAEIPRTLHGGVFRSEMPYDEGELSKSLMGILTQTTAPVVTFDNVTGELRSSKLAGLLTSTEYSDRILGSTNEVTTVNDRLWMVTGNNLTFGRDLVRRTLWVTIDPGVPHPELRTNFAIPNLSRWVREHRAELLHALLTLIAAWVADGRQPGPSHGADSFAPWQETVSGVLLRAGIAGEFDSAASVGQPVSEEDEELGRFLLAIHETWGTGDWTTKDITRASAPFANGEPVPPLREALPARFTETRKDPAGSLGQWFNRQSGAWTEGMTIRKRSYKRDGSAVFYIQEHTSGGAA